MRVKSLLVAFPVLLAGCADAFTSRVDVVARAAGAELQVDRLAEVLATARGSVLNRTVVERIAMVWVDYALFAHSILRGDSLLDSATVVAARWPDVQQTIASAYHALVVGDATTLDSAQVDSAYRAGQVRHIQHIFLEVAHDAAADVRRAKLRVAEDTRNRLRNGLPWAEASALTEDPEREPEGSLGVIGRGEWPPAFENAAYALAPGGISEVTETPAGYHILYRAPLSEVFDEFKEGVELRLEDAFDQEYLRGLGDRWDIKVRSSAIAAVRTVADDPIRARESGTVVGTYKDGGRFRVSDVTRWLQAMPLQVSQTLPIATDEQIEDMVGSLIRNAVLLEEAREAGIDISAATVDSLRDGLKRELSLLGAVVGLPRDTLAALRGLPPEMLRTVVELKLVDHLMALAEDKRRPQLVPPFLAEELRSRFEWGLVPAGIERVIQRSREIRVSMDSTATESVTPRPIRRDVPPADTTAGDDR